MNGHVPDRDGTSFTGKMPVPLLSCALWAASALSAFSAAVSRGRFLTHGGKSGRKWCAGSAAGRFLRLPLNDGLVPPNLAVGHWSYPENAVILSKT
jgi:hypothetical protein